MAIGITNFEMESSALAALSRLMGRSRQDFRGYSSVIANRLIKEANTGYNTIDAFIKTVLDRI